MPNEIKDELETYILERLEYLLLECKPEEYNQYETDIYLNLLNVICKPAPPEPLSLPGKKIKKITVKPYKQSVGKKIAYFSVGLAACIITFTLFSVKMPVSADPKQGFFHWIKRDETGMQMITSPSALEESPVPEECNCCSNCSCGCHEQ